MNKRLLHALAMLVSVFGIVSSVYAKDNWKGYIYPDKDDLTQSQYIGEFESREECRDEAFSALKAINAINDGDYECGLNCEDGVCEDTSN